MFTTAPPDEFSLKIDGKEFKYWSDLEFTRSLDGVAMWSFQAPFEPEKPEFRETWRPFEYQEAVLLAGGKPISKGVVVNIVPQVESAAKTVQISCYAKCGVWGDCTAPDDLQLQFDGLKLDKIASLLGSPFGITPALGADAGSKFEKAALNVGSKIWPFLTDLAKQRGLVVTSDEDGNPHFYQPGQSREPIAELDGNKQPVLSVSLATDGQGYFSSVTGFCKSKTGRKGNKFSQANPWAASGVVRPMSFEVDDTDPADGPAAVKAKLGRMFAAAASYNVEMATALDPNDQLYEPDRVIKLKAPDAMIYETTNFLIREVTVRATPKQKPTCSFSITLPGAFSGESPEALPWLG